MTRLVPALCLALTAAGCAHGRSVRSVPAADAVVVPGDSESPEGSSARRALRDRPARAETRTWLYQDNSGVTVSTTATRVEHPLAGGWVLSAGALADWISVERTQLDPVDQGGGGNTGHVHSDPDVVTSASPSAGGGKAAREWRWEGRAGLGMDRAVGEAPTRTRASIRASHEPDYCSFSGLLRSEAEILERNVTVSAFVGYGYDRVFPHEAPAGQAADWPAAHARVNVGGSVSQILSRRAVGGVGASATFQRGMLANPYRRAIVRTTLFPEVVPDARDRYTASANGSLYLGWRTALHVRQAVYWDTWDVFALTPSIELATEPTSASLLSLRARWTRQDHASFYEPHYHDVEAILSGDPRLGDLDEQAAGAALRWRLYRRRWTELYLLGSYEVSRVSYRQLPTDPTVGQLGSLGLIMSY